MEGIYRFGLFEANAATRELTREGTRIKIQEQPFRLLLLLLENSGQTITRESLRERLWPADTFVDFDSSLRVAVGKLRDALDDDADNPRFIATAPRVGYRFLAPVSVEEIRAPASAGVQVLEVPVRAARPRAWPWGLAAGIVIAICAALAWRPWRVAPRPVSSGLIVLAGFRNSTGRPVFDGSLYHALRIKLEESPYLDLAPEARVRSSVNGKAEAGSMPLAQARAACLAMGAKTVVYGAIEPRANGYNLRVEADACRDGRRLAEEEVAAPTSAELLPDLGRVADSLRLRLGESAASVKQHGAPMEVATTDSLVALKAFSQGEEQRARGRDYETIADYKLALDLDPHFALACARLGTIYSNAQETALATQYLQKAFDLRDHATERERLYIAARYYSNVTGDLDEAMQTYQLWHQIYPRDLVPANNLADDLIAIGQPEQAIEPAQAAVRLAPDNGFPYIVLAQALQRTGRFREAKQTYLEAVSRKIDGVNIHMIMLHIAFAEHDEAEIKRQLEWARGNPREGEILNTAAWMAFARGQVRSGHRLSAEAQDRALKNGLPEFAALAALDAAQLDGDLGRTAAARADVARALRVAGDSRNVQAFAALALARVGDVQRARRLADAVSRSAPADTIMQRVVLPTVRALADLHQHAAADAINELQTVLPYDLNRALEMSSVYYRGEAYLADRRFPDAASEFRKLIAHSVVRPDSMYVPLAELGLGRVLRLSGDPAGSRTAYESFFSAWKDADAGVPILRAAKAEYARLR